MCLVSDDANIAEDPLLVCYLKEFVNELLHPRPYTKRSRRVDEMQLLNVSDGRSDLSFREVSPSDSILRCRRIPHRAAHFLTQIQIRH